MTGMIEAMFPNKTPEEQFRIAMAVVESWHPGEGERRLREHDTPSDQD